MTKPPKSWWSFCWKTRDNPCSFFSPSLEHESTCKFKSRGQCTHTEAVNKNWVNVSILKRIEGI